MRGAELTKRLLAFARRQDLKPERIDIGDRIDDLLKLLTRTLGEDVRIQTHVSRDIWPIEVDPTQLESVIVNLAVNARDAMPGGGTLTVEAENASLDAAHRAIQSEIPPGDYVRISVSDTGIGIPPEIVERVFEPFFTTKAVGKGTGLGLSMVHGFTRQSNGHVTIYSAPGHGTTLRLYLPRAHAEETDRKETPAKEELPLGRGERILVVEDNAQMRAVVVQLLSDLEYRTLEAGTATEALSILGSGEAVDLVFSDVIMPGNMTGFDLADAVFVRYPDTPVMLCSGFTERAGPLQGQRSGKSLPLLSKPYRRDELARAVRDALGT